ncbi:2-hydroxy-3-oxopropionate reductase [Amycolatopsis sp. WAC 01375]|uniref:NAD(P)-dependent oxidoreductase n=1 Tax=unclassified Amycolatopsis TaxID=2618356 RepID=UPI000F79569A|nr:MULTISPECIES: NAD(P)-dependent oxidoreductase [unclassified Amycolatopsis]RSM70233.1 2-hydroxy-3-oxopropionate reductase [Amycolatopsis sp. WAC 01375]RSN21398.1 2-hydroxy-3-oxopropionate reductase [Amycolatopsis sp. WAC 01416]
MGISRVGFAGLGSMGGPMAVNLARAGIPLLVWNRTPGRTAVPGAEVAGDAAELFERCEVVILMLKDAAAVDAVLERGRSALAGRTIVHMGTTAPEHSRVLESELLAAGAKYVEAPVSGSRVPAEAGELVAMLAGDPAAIEEIRELFGPLCRETVECGPVPNGLLMKLAVNVHLTAVVTSLAETVHFARTHGLDLGLLAGVLGAGQLASPILRVKAPKLVEEDFSPQASITNVLANVELIAAAAGEAGLTLPLIEASRVLYAEAARLGFGEEDMVAVVKALEAPRSED